MVILLGKVGAGGGGSCNAIKKLLFILIFFLMKSQRYFHYERTRGLHKTADSVFHYGDFIKNEGEKNYMYSSWFIKT